MKTKKRGSGVAVVGQSSPGTQPPGMQQLTPEESLQMARNAVRAAMPTIIGIFLEEAKSGSCQHAKFLMEFAKEEREPRAVTAEVHEDESLETLLMREIRAVEAEEQAAR